MGNLDSNLSKSEKARISTKILRKLMNSQNNPNLLEGDGWYQLGQLNSVTPEDINNWLGQTGFSKIDVPQNYLIRFDRNLNVYVMDSGGQEGFIFITPNKNSNLTGSFNVIRSRYRDRGFIVSEPYEFLSELKDRNGETKKRYNNLVFKVSTKN